MIVRDATYVRNAVTISIPRSAKDRRELCYTKLLCRVHADRILAHAFEGRFLKPGSRVEYAALWPDTKYPASPILFEFAGRERSGLLKHQKSRFIHVLWRFDLTELVWIEIARTVSEGQEWVPHIMAIALRELGAPPPPDPRLAATLAGGFLSRLDSEVQLLAADERGLVWSFVYEQLAARMAESGLQWDN